MTPDTPILQTVIIIILVLTFNWILGKLLWRLRHRFMENHQIVQMTLVSSLYKPTSYFTWYAAALLSIDLVTSMFFKFRLFDLTQFLTLGAIVALGWFLMRWKSNWINEMRILHIEHATTWSPDQLDLVSKSATAAIFILIGLQLLQTVGINIQTLVAFGGIGGLALAFASQQVISNFFGGLMVYFTYPFRIGEWISIPERKIEGHIEDIGWYMTRLRNFEKRPVYIPNSIFTQTLIITPSRMTHQRMKELICLRHEDLPVIMPIINEIKAILKESPKIDQQEKMIVRLLGLNPSSLDIEIIAYVRHQYYDQFETVRLEFLLKVASMMDRHGAKIATPITYQSK